MDFDAKHLIRAVKQHPALYCKHDSMYYSHRKHKDMLWREVCKTVVPNWEQMRPPDKLERLHDLQRRWKSLRTCFSREIQFQKQEKERLRLGTPVKRRKKYEYFNQMRFLIDKTEDAVEGDGKDDISDTASEDNENSNSEIKIENLGYAESSNQQNNKITSIMIEAEPRHSTDYFSYLENGLQESSVNLSRDIKDDVDEDKQFLLSLVPSFRKLNDKQKFEARIGILNVLKDISFKDE